MAERSSKSLGFKHISHATQEALDYLDARRKGKVPFIQTKWKKFNRACMDGIEWDCIMTFGGMSGTGKSSIAEEFESSILDSTADPEIAVLNFNWEMISSRKVVRKLSNRMQMTVKDMFSAGGSSLDDYQMNQIFEQSKDIYNYPVFYVDTPGTAGDVLATFSTFRSTYPQYKKFIIILDHTILIDNEQGQKQLQALEALQKVWIKIKKYGAETGEYRSIILQLSQLNRNIEASERVMSLEGQYPLRSDIFGGDSVYQASDYVVISHRPELLHIAEYGPENLPTEGYLYWHLLKAREGDPVVLQMINNLKYNRIDE